MTTKETSAKNAVPSTEVSVKKAATKRRKTQLQKLNEKLDLVLTELEVQQERTARAERRVEDLQNALTKRPDSKTDEEEVIEAVEIVDDVEEACEDEIFQDEEIVIDASEEGEEPAKTPEEGTSNVTDLVPVSDEPELLPVLASFAKKKVNELAVFAKEHPAVSGALAVATPIALSAIASAAGVTDGSLADMAFANEPKTERIFDDGFEGKVYDLKGVVAKDGPELTRQLELAKDAIIAKKKLKHGDDLDFMSLEEGANTPVPRGFKKMKILQTVKFGCGQTHKIHLGYRFRKRAGKE
jgi:hypothetical protein